MGFGKSGVGRMEAQLLSDQEQDERNRSVPPSVPLGDDEPAPLEALMNDDGSATVELPDDDSTDVTELEDGSALVDLEGDEPAKSKSFDENLAETLDSAVLSRLATDMIDAIERDKEARKRRDEQYAEGIRRTGLGNEAPGGATFEGASKAVHPVLIEGCVDFAARSIKELFPASGPVKTRILGKQTKAKLQRAERKAQYMNWQATTQIKEYRRELEVLLTQLPLGGGQYLKVWHDARWKRVRTEFVPIDDLLLPFEATSLGSSSRVTHVQRINKAQFKERTDSGLYREIPMMGEAVISPQKTESAEASAAVEGVEDPSFNEDGLRLIYEVQATLTLEDDPLAELDLMPYILTIDEATQKVLALRRNWEEDDGDRAEALSWIVEFPFIPWRGAYPIGLTHLIGGLSSAATGALRALLDSAHINNMPGGMKLKGARTTGQSISIEPTQLTEIDAGPGVDDIRKLAMPLPFNPPSTVLFQLLGWLTDQAKGVVGTAEERIADAGNNMPVGTALALIEQGSITFSSIHARLHAAQKEVLAIIHRLNAKHLSDNETVEELGELVVSKADFQGPMDVEPVSDPNIFSDAQRYAQLQAVMQLATQSPQFYKGAELQKRALQLLKFPAADQVLAVPADPEELDPVGENVAACDPLKAVKAYDDQDHMDHLRSHLAFMTSPIYGSNPLIAPQALPVLLSHCREHLVMLYGAHGRAAVEAKTTVEKMRGKAADGAEADALAISDQQLAQLVGPLMPLLQKAQQLAQQLTQGHQPPDPRLLAVQAKQQSDAQRLQLEGQKLQAQAQGDQQDRQLEQMRLQLEAQTEQQRQAAEQQRASVEAHLNELAQQAETQRHEVETQLEQWQTQVEMMTSKHNADLAANLATEQAGADRDLKLQIQEMVGQQAEQRIMLEARLDAMLQLLQPPKGEQP